MKRISFLMVTLLMSVSMMMAQGPRRGGDRGDRKPMEPKEQAERMTERMTKEYNLTDAQKAKVQKVNLEMAEKNKDNRPNMRPEGNAQNAKKDDKAKREKPTEAEMKARKEEMEKRMAEMQKEREAYNAEIKKILTAEQYAKFEKNQAERAERMKAGNQGREKK